MSRKPAALTPRQELVLQLAQRYGGHAKAAEVLREYRRALGPEGGKMSPVLADLKMFCGLTAAMKLEIADPHGRSLERVEGRREVWFRIEMLLSIDPEEVAANRTQGETDEV